MSDNKPLCTLYKCAADDIRGRLFSLVLEIRHLQKNAAYFLNNHHIFRLLEKEDRTLDADDTLSTAVSIKDVVKAINKLEYNTDTEKACAFIVQAAQQLKQEIYLDIEGVEEYLFDDKHRLSECGEVELPKERLILISQALFRHKANIYIRDLGQLQNRFGQEIEHILPDSPGPTVRRRHEHGVTDKYLSELTRWVHRDIIRLCRDLFGADYPYKNVPVTLQYWQHEYSSQHSAVRTTNQHNLWRLWLTENIEFPEENENEQTFFIRHSYWALERPVIHPTIAHELAHRVIRDCVGRRYIPALGRRARSGTLGRLSRRLISCIEEWAGSLGIPHDRTDQEIIADLLAATRFGHSFLYAWFLEMLNSEHEASHQQRDEHGWYEIAEIEEQAKNPIPYPDDKIPATYLRGRVLVKWLAMLGVENDEQAKNLRDSVEKHLQLLLETRYESNPDMQSYWHSCSMDLIDAAINFNAVDKAKDLYYGFIKNKDFISNKNAKGWLMFNQRSSRGVSAWLGEKLGVESLVVKSVTDAQWRFEWGNASSEGSMQVQFSRYFHIAMEDYLVKTANFKRLHNALEDDLDPEEFDSKVADSNYLSEIEHRNKWLEYKKLFEDKRPSYDERYESIISFTDLDFHLREEESYRASDILGDIYHMELTVFSTPKDTLESMHKPKDDWLMQGCPDGDLLESEATLGRYDRFFLYKASPSKKTIGIPWDYIPSAKDNDENWIPSYYSRKKIVQKINSPIFTESENDKTTVVIVFISLKWYAFRTLFIRWLLNDKSDFAKDIRNKTKSVFLSTGWDDVVLFLSENVLLECFNVIQGLHDHPFVKKTESIFTKVALDQLGDDSGNMKKYQCVFLVRVKDSKNTFLNNLQAKLKNEFEIKFSPVVFDDIHEGTVLVSHIFGEMDYVIEAPMASGDKHQLLRDILYGLDSVARVQTHIRGLESN